MSARPAVFLDRDGTIIEDVGYLSRIEDLRFYPWSIDAIRLLNRAGFAVCITTNQGGIGMGFYDEAFVQRTHAEMSATIAAAAAEQSDFTDDAAIAEWQEIPVKLVEGDRDNIKLTLARDIEHALQSAGVRELMERLRLESAALAAQHQLEERVAREGDGEDPFERHTPE